MASIRRKETWPQVIGRLEYVNGRLEYLPPCGERQQRIVIDVATEINLWARARTGFVVGGNEAGMKLGDDARGADVAVWRATGKPASSGFAREAPILVMTSSATIELDAAASIPEHPELPALVPRVSDFYRQL
jgi:Uma2 family endonuclease